MIVTKDFMMSLPGYQILCRGLIFRKKVSQFLNIRVDFSIKNRVYIQLETVGSGFVDSLKTNKVEDLLRLEKMFE